MTSTAANNWCPAADRRARATLGPVGGPKDDRDPGTLSAVDPGPGRRAKVRPRARGLALLEPAVDVVVAAHRGEAAVGVALEDGEAGLDRGVGAGPVGVVLERTGVAVLDQDAGLEVDPALALLGHVRGDRRRQAQVRIPGHQWRPFGRPPGQRPGAEVDADLLDLRFRPVVGDHRVGELDRPRRAVQVDEDLLEAAPLEHPAGDVLDARLALAN